MKSLDTVFCVAPWVNIHVDTGENVKPCCRGAGVSIPISNIDSYLNSSDHSILNVKQQLLENKLPIDCVDCQERNWYSEFTNININSSEDIDVVSLDLRWSNTCQLNCTYCNEKQSSSWAALKKNIIPISNYRISQGKQQLFDLIQHQKNQIRRVSLLGGEPLLIKENLEVLKFLSDDVQIDIFTNLNIDLENNPIFSDLSKRTNVNWYISMENIGDKFEFVRRGSSWSRQVNNVESLLKKSQSKFTPTLQSQYCVYSATGILELYRWASSYNLKINWNWLTHPVYLDFANFPSSYKLTSLSQIQEVKNIKSDYIPNLENIIHQLYSSMNQGNQTHVDRCNQWHQTQESLYFNNSQNFKDLWPEFFIS